VQALVIIEVMLRNVLGNFAWEKVFDGEFLLAAFPDFGGADGDGVSVDDVKVDVLNFGRDQWCAFSGQYGKFHKIAQFFDVFPSG